MNHRVSLRWALLLGAAAVWGCSDAPTVPRENMGPTAESAVHFWDDLATTRWNLRATALFQSTSPAPPNGQAWASRTLTYLSIAQYRAALAATAPSNRSKRASVTAAIARASVDVLTRFYTQTPGYSPPSSIPTTLENMLIADRTEPSWPGDANTDAVLGDAIGHQVALAVWNQAQADRYNAASTLTDFAALQATRPIGAGYWVPSGAAVRGFWGVKPFFLDESQLVVLPPPANLAGLETAAAFVLTTTTVGSADQLAQQLAIANLWNKVPPNGPFTAGEWNQRADSLIQSYHRTEIEAARILATANIAAFDSQIECFATKYTYWVARPAQVNNAIVPAFATPNHPSYPSGHSCISAAFGATLSHAFPDAATREWLASKVEEAGWSRVYAGIHYVFDIGGGHEVGERAAAKALAGNLD
ncbi:MAG TPA: phosphatase PAP2 family protein [Gemmatimonadaceae bacterium]|nr:phosphatase PAP2 family protein [Gemmatimonadaceae bacterium]